MTLEITTNDEGKVIWIRGVTTAGAIRKKGLFKGSIEVREGKEK